MTMLWVCRVDPKTRRPQVGQHIAFRWKDYQLVETACGLEFDGERTEWVDADMVLYAGPVPAQITCPECAALTVQELADQYARWMRGEAR